MQIIYLAAFGRTTDTAAYQLVMLLSMLFPAIGNIITRIITKEGFEGSMLRVNIKGRIKYYLTAVLLPFIYTFAAVLILCIFFLPKGSACTMLRGMSFGNIVTTILFLAVVSTLCSMTAFGEEFGWRGYLTPKLEQLMGKPAAMIVSGVIWGLWHALAMVIGHNLGTDYPLYPYSGILLMCVFCTVMGIYFTALTKAANSVYPAAAAHGANNNIPSAFAAALILPLGETADLFSGSSLTFSLVMTAAGAVFAVITACLITMLRKKKQNG